MLGGRMSNSTGTFKIALAGNPNSGKTTLFNALTGSTQQVGNWPGVTVEKKEGSYSYQSAAFEVTDLPGTYSLDPGTPEQRLAGEFLSKGGADVIINIVDAGNLSRSMLLTLQLMEKGIPMIVAVNFMDEAERAGLKVDSAKLASRLKIPVVPISAARGDGLQALKAAVKQMTEIPVAPEPLMTCSSGCSSCSAALQGFSCIDTVFGDCVSGAPPQAALAAFDRIALNKWLAVPVFALVMAAVFTITFGPLVGKASDFVDWLVNVQLLEAVRGLLSSAGAPGWITGLLADGAIGGAGSVLIFLPQIAVLFFLLSLLEGTGYMARAAFVMDRALSWLGLSGRSFVTLIMGFGCTVPSIMASRILEEEEERKIAVIVAPFISCSARMPIYVLIAGAFFGAKAGLAAASMYFLGIIVMIASALLLSRTVFKSRSSSAFVLEMPPYRIPRLNYLAMATWHKTKDFIVRAGTLIVLVSIGIWVLSNVSFSLKAVTDPSQSMLATLGRLIVPLLSPLGLGEWRIGVALLSGIAAKEIVASTISLLAGTGPDALASLGLNAASALAFMSFSLLYVPCAATIVVMRRELGSARQAVLAVLYGIAVAWLVSFAIFRIASLVIR